MHGTRERVAPSRTILFLFLAFLSGFAALVYQVLWLKELGLLFGNTAHAAATTLAVFFLGLAGGGRFFGAKAAGTRRPLRAYALLEIGIASSALLYFLVTRLFHAVYGAVFESVEHSLLLSTLVKFVLSLGILFPPAFFMGGTFPYLGEQLVRTREELGRTGSLLYAVNTAGAALGAFAAGFVLPIQLGFRGSYLVAVAINVVVAVVAWGWAGPARAASAGLGDVAPPEGEPPPGALLRSPRRIAGLAFLSGALTLALEVLWTRMFAQVFQNSVYSFSAILVTFLVALALGSALANALCRLRTSPTAILGVLLVLSGALAGSTPFVFHALTDGLQSIDAEGGWGAYVAAIFRGTAIVILVPGILIGSVFPYLLRISQGVSTGAGLTIGRLAAINGIGGILGSLAAGFLLLEGLGLWASIQVLATLYFLALPIAVDELSPRRLVPRIALALVALAALAAAGPSRLPVIRLDPGEAEQLLEVSESGHGTVAVIARGSQRGIKVDNTYMLGGLDGYFAERRQSQIPLFLHPDARSVFFLGMGTGTTAGGALDFPVREVVVCELLPNVVAAARRHFAQESNGLFEDPRVRIVVEDGRHFLAGTSQRYDVIISELFVPWHAGTGTLYSREHFRIARSRLRPGGIFVQWLPLTHMTRTEFDIIARTMLEEFPQVTLWRANFVSHAEVALVGAAEIGALDPAAVARNVAQVIPRRAEDRVTDADVVPWVLYAGNLSACRPLFADAPVNTDDRPVIEYVAPKAVQRERSGEVPWLTSFELSRLFGEVFSAVPPGEDPHLEALSPEQIAYVQAGLALFRVGVLLDAKRVEEARAVYREFFGVIPFDPFPWLK